MATAGGVALDDVRRYFERAWRRYSAYGSAGEKGAGALLIAGAPHSGHVSASV